MNTQATTTVTPSTPFTQNLEKPQQRQTAKEIIAANVKGLIEQLDVAACKHKRLCSLSVRVAAHISGERADRPCSD